MSDELTRAQHGHALTCAFIRLGTPCDCDAMREPAPDHAALIARLRRTASDRIIVIPTTRALLREAADALAALRGATPAPEITLPDVGCGRCGDKHCFGGCEIGPPEATE